MIVGKPRSINLNLDAVIEESLRRIGFSFKFPDTWIVVHWLSFTEEVPCW